MSDKLIEELARAIAEMNDDYDGGELLWRVYIEEARAVLPIIARIRADAIEECARAVSGMSPFDGLSDIRDAIRALKVNP